MEKKDSELTKEAIERLEYLSRILDIDMPLISEQQQYSNKLNKTDKKTRGEAKIASPKLVEGLSPESKQRLLNLYEIVQDEESTENILISEQEDEDRIAALVEQISKNVAKRIEEEEKQLRLEAEKKETPIVENTMFGLVRGRVNKNSEKKERFTEPKKRILFMRLMNRIGYNLGAFKYTEDRYLEGRITREDVEESKNSDNWFDRSLYRSVQRYEDVVDDVKVKRGWRAFKLGLLAVLLAGSISLGAWAKNEINEWLEESHRIVTIDNARDNERLAAQSLILQCTEDTEYEFKHLSNREMMDAALRIPVIENKKPEAVYRTAMGRFEDQELLDKILEETYGEELVTFSPEKIRDLKQLAYEFLGENEEKQQWIRDPQVVDNLKEKQKEEGMGIGD